MNALKNDVLTLSGLIWNIQAEVGFLSSSFRTPPAVSQASMVAFTPNLWLRLANLSVTALGTGGAQQTTR